MRRHEPGCVWCLRRDFVDYVRTTAPTSGVHAGVLVRFNGVTLTMTRMDARLLARRITQMLEATK